jgi:CHAT domain-containing protein
MVVRAALVLTLMLWSFAAGAQTMTKAQEAAQVKGFELTMQAQDLFSAGRYAESETLMREVLRLHQKAGSGPLSIATAMHNVAATVAQQGRAAEALDMAREALRLRRENGAVDNAIASSERLLASILANLGRSAEAMDLQQEAVMRALNGEGVDPTTLVRSFATLAYFTAESGDVSGGIALVNQLVPMLQQMAPHDVALTLNTVGRLSSMAGQPQQAEAYYREALRHSSALPVSKDWSVVDKATVLNNLAAMLRARGRHVEAEGLFLQARGMLEEAGLTALPLMATILDGLGEVWRAQHRYREAYDAERRGLDIRQATLPDGHPGLGVSFSNIGITLLLDGQADLAASAFEKAVDIQRKSGDRVRLGRSSANLSAAYAALGKTDWATDIGGEALDILAEALPKGHEEVTRAAFNYAWLSLAAGRADEALPVARIALADYRAASWRLGSDETIGAGTTRESRRQILSVAAALWEADRDGGLAEAFEAAQWAQASEAAQTARRVAARFAAGDGEIAALARQRQDLINLWRAADAQYLARLSAAGEADPQTVALRDQSTGLEAEISALDQQLARAFKDYANLTQPSAATVADIRAALKPGEAFLMPITTQDETFVFAITPDGASWARTALTETTLDADIRALRADLDPTGRSRSAAALEDEDTPKGPAFDGAAAYRLYQALVEPVADRLAGASTVFVVQDGALAGLPLSVLLASPLDVASDDPLRRADWLIRRHAFVTLPSAASLPALAATRNPRAARIDFAGFGDPVFTGPADGSGEVELTAMLSRGTASGADVTALAPLPGTRQEILALARDFRAPDDAVYLGAEATEAGVKASTVLREARVVVFATHGLLAGELAGLAEPALAFSAPTEATETDDGLLTASEAAGLDLAADWVILSACNTAAPNGQPGGEGLSGLASAFLYAGARSLLVSHWPVRDDAAGLLTRRALRIAAEDSALGHAEALRRSMLDLIDNGTIPNAAHPSTWAPFVVVGGNGR